MKKYALNLATIVSLFATTIAHATVNGIYLGGEMGYGNIYQSPTDSAVTSVNGGVGGFSGRLFGGYQFTKHYALEFGYTRFSNATISYTATNPALANYYLGNTLVSTYALDLVVKAMVPLPRDFTLFGKLGFAAINENGGTVVLTSPIDSTQVSTYINKTSVFPTFSLGLAYEVNENFTTDISWMRIQEMGGSNIQSTDLIAIGLNYYIG